MRLTVYGLHWVRDAYDWHLVLAHGGSRETWQCVDLVTGQLLHVAPEGEHVKQANRNHVADVGLNPNDVPESRGSQVYDPHWDRRQRSPWFRSVVAVLEAFAGVVFYSVDWRPWLFEPDCPRDQRLYDIGYPTRSDTWENTYEWRIEGFAAGCQPRPGEPLSDCVLRRLRDQYDSETDRSAPAMTFDELLEACGWTDEVFEALDATYAQDCETLAQHRAELGIHIEPRQLPMRLAA